MKVVIKTWGIVFAALLALFLGACDLLSPDESETPAAVTIAVVPGVGVPVTGGTPVTAITPTDEYTGTVSWEPSVDAVFAANTVYTAVITLTAKEGYTLDEASENFFTVAGAVATNDAGSGVIRAAFPATAAQSETRYDGTVYELIIEPMGDGYIWLTGPAATGIPSGTIYDKNDLGWNDAWAGDRTHWIDVGFVHNNQVIIKLPETISDSILNNESGDYFGWFDNWEVSADYSFALMDLEGGTNNALFYYAKNAAPNHDVDGIPMDLDQGWNFLVMPFEGGPCWKAENLEELYENGFRWYLIPGFPEPFLIAGIFEATVQGRTASLCLNSDGSFFVLGMSDPTPTGTYMLLDDKTTIELNFLVNPPETAQWSGTMSQTGIDFGDVTYTRKAGVENSIYAGSWFSNQGAFRMLVAGDLTMTIEFYNGNGDYNESNWDITAKGYLEISGSVNFQITHAWDTDDTWTDDPDRMDALLNNRFGGATSLTGTVNGYAAGSSIQLTGIMFPLIKQDPSDPIGQGN